ncbi:hypothetical protein GEV33_007318 [Tenebrio molitor]|uniref:Uncharacterized protein n=1 Tax=Tenebrio molitor TaxID=7067 RepID=A0A8J6HIT0_TENMO|nr:hypothetical protein GEV33_007318 [Tenebrio molitor]
MKKERASRMKIEVTQNIKERRDLKEFADFKEERTVTGSGRSGRIIHRFDGKVKKQEDSAVSGEVEERRGFRSGSRGSGREKRIHRFQEKSKKEEDSPVPGEVEERRGFTGSRGSRRKKRIHRFHGKSKKEEDSAIPGGFEERRGHRFQGKSKTEEDSSPRKLKNDVWKK